MIEDLRVVQRKPPWYWRLIGRTYWSGWQIQGLAVSGNTYGWYWSSDPAPEPPTPEDVAGATVEAINGVLARVYQHQLTMRPLPDRVQKHPDAQDTAS